MNGRCQERFPFLGPALCLQLSKHLKARIELREVVQSFCVLEIYRGILGRLVASSYLNSFNQQGIVRVTGLDGLLVVTL